MKTRFDKEMSRQLRVASRMPHAETGQRIGLFGGSFNPPHGGHVLVSEIALRRLKLDQIWWIVTPGNPLKNHRELAPLSKRIAQCSKVTSDPAVKITAFELAHPTRFTADMLEIVAKTNPGVNFTWIMGADNLAGFHHWQEWRKIAGSVPIAVVDRPGSTLASRSSMAALVLARYRLDESDASLLPTMKPPVWTLIHGPRSSLSSTKLRKSDKAMT